MEQWEEIVELVREFYKVFEQEKYIGELKNNEERIKLRQKLLIEEYTEYRNAREEKNIVEILDAVIDMYYIYIGTLLEKIGDVEKVAKYIYFSKDLKLKVLWGYVEKYNFKNIFIDAFKEVHKSNLSKLDENGKPVYREDGKVIKGINYFRPNLAQFLK